jgi:hypothetical protein
VKKEDKKEKDIIIQFLDYGTKALVSIEDIYPLRPEYLELQTQAAHASLYGK